MQAQEQLARGRGFGKSAISGTFWMGAGYWLNAGANFLKIVILARALPPSQYGLVASIYVVSRLGEAGGSLGFQAGVVQMAEEPDEHTLNVAWTVDRLLVKGTSALVLFLAAPFVARIFGGESVEGAFRALALYPVLEMVESNAAVVLHRKLEYRRRVLLEFGTSIGSLSVVPIAIFWPSVWVAVFSILAGQLVRSTMSYVIYPHLPKPTLSSAVMRRLWPFGKWLVAVQILQRFREQIDKLLLGALLGPVSLGVFELGQRLGTQIVSAVDLIGLKVLFPIFARMQSDHEGRRRRYRMTLEVILLFAVPLCALLAVAAEPLVLLLFGEKWRASIPVVQILTIAGAIKVVVGTGRSLLRGVGKPASEFGLDAVLILVLVPSVLLLGSKFGVIGAAVAVGLAYTMQIPFWLSSVRAVTGLSATDILRTALFPLTLTVTTAMAGFGAQAIVVAAGFGIVAMSSVSIAAAGATMTVMFAIGWRLYRWEGAQAVGKGVSALVGRRFGGRDER